MLTHNPFRHSVGDVVMAIGGIFARVGHESFGEDISCDASM